MMQFTTTADKASHHVPGLPIEASSRSMGMPNMVNSNCGSCRAWCIGRPRDLMFSVCDFTVTTLP
jgi:hypothetical protein